MIAVNEINIFAPDTKVEVPKTRAQIEAILKRFGATHYAYGSAPEGAMIAFTHSGRSVRFNLPMPPKTTFQQERSRWRALFLAIKAKLVAVNTGISTFEEEFLSHVVMPSGLTVHEEVRAQVKDAYLSGRPMPLLLAGPTP